MNKNEKVTVYGYSRISKERRLLFYCISIFNWNVKGKENAERHGYKNFEFYSIPTYENKFSLPRKISI